MAYLYRLLMKPVEGSMPADWSLVVGDKILRVTQTRAERSTC
jgi:hypothetical protein